MWIKGNFKKVVTTHENGVRVSSCTWIKYQWEQVGLGYWQKSLKHLSSCYMESHAVQEIMGCYCKGLIDYVFALGS